MSTYSCSNSDTKFVTLVSFFIAMIFNSFISSFGILTDKCAFSDIYYLLLFFIGMFIFGITNI